ncbi:hypothetical protein DOY81_009430, partial [Sarcophaga bullata]
HVGGCGITDEVSQWMENIQNSAVEELPTPMSKDERIPKKRAPTEDKILLAAEEYNAAKKSSNLNNSNSSSSSNSNSNSQQEKTTSSSAPTSPPLPLPPKKYANNYQNNGAMDDFKYPFEKYTREANFRDVVADDDDDDGDADGADDDEVAAATAGAGYFYDPETGRRLQPTDRDWHERVHERVRRASGSSGSSARREDNKNTCSLYITTDPLIWRHIREGIADEHDRSHKYERDIKTREEITSLIAHHVTAVNYIYRNTKFDGRTEHRNIRFEETVGGQYSRATKLHSNTGIITLLTIISRVPPKVSTV